MRKMSKDRIGNPADYGEDFEREIKAVMRIGRVFQGQHHWVQNEAHLLRVQNLTEQLVIVHNRRCQLEL
ncbi:MULTISPECIES: hypothetical protein [unclassified Bacillus (in: firmicutes)]|uniref:hypothetical protein n=1 Tax=unclassified Bacillus (in: firmicutes) TaxID=185979 RepID=UPI001BE7A5DB|nr:MULTISPECIES: hypothetical protein [unclassified Bacillus (in: firmicutes)]MBT2614791.1 hypothetical protein [Bacillus sp. ISL-78]MBT2631911.1 hypothetical protein [Bacillus sp. ISL-101]MBT2715772.1 hypothetical protein [Bacillus sp. ISL-57]